MLMLLHVRGKSCGELAMQTSASSPETTAIFILKIVWILVEIFAAGELTLSDSTELCVSISVIQSGGHSDSQVRQMTMFYICYVLMFFIEMWKLIAYSF